MPIVGDGAIAQGNIGAGRLIPVLIIDTSAVPQFRELVRMHGHLPPGDVRITWGTYSKRATMIPLMLEFLRPVELDFALSFQVPRQACLIDNVLSAHCVYLQSGKEGDRLLKDDLDRDRLLVEIPVADFDNSWNVLFLSFTTRGFREKGRSRQEAKQLAEEAVAEWRKLSQLRMP